MTPGFSRNPLVQAVETPPIAEAHRWAAEAKGPILDTAQAVPAWPPAPALRRHLAEALEWSDTHLYTEILGHVLRVTGGLLFQAFPGGKRNLFYSSRDL